MRRLSTTIKNISFIVILTVFIFNFIDVSFIANAAAATLNAPASVKAVSSSYNSISVSWSGVSGVSGYEVYRAVSSTGAYTLISKVTTSSYNNTALTTGSTYYYKIRAYKDSGTTKIYGKYSTIVSSKPVPSAPTSLKAVSSTYNSINLSWVGVTGASGYEIYRATSSAGYNTLVARSTVTSYSNTGLATGTTYYYKIRAYKTLGTTKIYGSYTSIVSSKPIPSAPTAIKVTSSSYNSINVSWGGVSGASGYEVHKAVAPTGAYSLVSTTAATNFTNTGLSAAATYYYKIRAYRTVSGIKVYSDFSSTISGTTAAIKVTSISLNKTTDNLTVGDIDTLTVTIAPTNATNKTIKWTSSDNTIASVDSNGKITAVKSGTVIITAAAADGDKTDKCTVTVRNPIVNVASVGLNKASSSLAVGSTDTLTAAINPSNATNQAVAWTTSDNTIATVDNTGKVSAQKSGTVIITVTTTDGNKTASCTINVSNAKIQGIDVSSWQGSINWGLVKGSGIQFAMLRSSYRDGTGTSSSSGTDSMFETNYAGAKANGIAVGAYHYSYATTVDQAVKEANFFISKLQGKQFEYPVCVDIEDNSQGILDKKTLTDIALTYLNTLKQAGYYPMIYSNKYWFTSVLDDTRLTTFDHWVAQYYTSLTYAGQAGMWQYTSSGIVNGINGSVDMDISYVDYASKIKSLHLNGF